MMTTTWNKVVEYIKSDPFDLSRFKAAPHIFDNLSLSPLYIGSNDEGEAMAFCREDHSGYDHGFRLCWIFFENGYECVYLDIDIENSLSIRESETVNALSECRKLGFKPMFNLLKY